MARVQEDKNTVTIRDGSAAHTRKGQGMGKTPKLGTDTERIARDAMPTGGDGVSLSRRLGRDSRAFNSSAYMSICVRDSTSRKQGSYTGETKINANGGRRCRRDGVGISASPCKSMRAAGNMASFPSP